MRTYVRTCVSIYICVMVAQLCVCTYVCTYSTSASSQDSMCRMTQLRELDLKNNRLSVLPGVHALIESIHVSILELSKVQRKTD